MYSGFKKQKSKEIGNQGKVNENGSNISFENFENKFDNVYKFDKKKSKDNVSSDERNKSKDKEVKTNEEMSSDFINRNIPVNKEYVNAVETERQNRQTTFNTINNTDKNSNEQIQSGKIEIKKRVFSIESNNKGPLSSVSGNVKNEKIVYRVTSTEKKKSTKSNDKDNVSKTNIETISMKKINIPKFKVVDLQLSNSNTISSSNRNSDSNKNIITSNINNVSNVKNHRVIDKDIMNNRNRNDGYLNNEYAQADDNLKSENDYKYIHNTYNDVEGVSTLTNPNENITVRTIPIIRTTRKLDTIKENGLDHDNNPDTARHRKSVNPNAEALANLIKEPIKHLMDLPLNIVSYRTVKSVEKSHRPPTNSKNATSSKSK